MSLEVEVLPETKMPRATHEGSLAIGDCEIPCYVLEGGNRVISTRGVMKALGRSWKGRKTAGTKMPVFLEANNLKPFISNELQAVPFEIEFKTNRGTVSEGLKANLLPLICEVYLKARESGVLTASQLPIAAKCEILVISLAQVGIVALIDEATGFQYDRPRRELESQLKKFLSESLRRWVRTFPAAYFEELCRLRGVELRSDMRLPQYFGHLTNNLVYRRLAPGLLRRLKERRVERGSQANKLHSWLSEDSGFPEVLVHLGTVVGLMKMSPDFDYFEKQIDRVLPIYPETPGIFDDPEDWK